MVWIKSYIVKKFFKWDKKLYSPGNIIGKADIEDIYEIKSLLKYGFIREQEQTKEQNQLKEQVKEQDKKDGIINEIVDKVKEKIKSKKK